MPKELVSSTTSFTLTWGVNPLITLVGPETGRAWAFLVGTLIYLGICVAQLDRNIANQFYRDKLVLPFLRKGRQFSCRCEDDRRMAETRTILEAHSLDARDSLDDGGFPVGDVTDGAYVDRSLSSDDFGCCRRQRRDIEILGVGLGRQRRFLNGSRRRYGRLLLGSSGGRRLRLLLSLGFRSAL